MKLEPEWEAEVAKDFMERYRAGGKAEVVFDHNVGRTRWDKLLYNATVNPLCAILEMSVGDLGESGVAETVIRPAVLELVSIAGSLGIEIEEDEVEATLQGVMAGGDFEPSMLADRKKASQR
ncbi:ketopantoate reductase-like protein 2 [Elsinoe australis]|uniref:Ketopantoate reductase-like protein 2 n=1 Tax=Elsinoe australis TaxID=40998 RepID=A0A4U7ALS9_9PEZI|nr:ketopantoate reductase-like protein 2 [Elsinoe australis]